MLSRKLVIAALALASAASASAQTTLLDTGYRQMYNLEFDEAHQTFHEWEQSHPDDPLAPVSDAAAYLFSEFERLHILQSEFFTDDDAFKKRHKLNPDPQVKQNFENDLAKTGQLTDSALKKSPGDENAQFSEILRLGLHSDYLALVEKRYVAALSDLKTGRLMAEHLVANNPAYSDAYLAIGVENYMLSLKSAPLRWALRLGGAETDKERGLEKLRVTAEKGHYLLPYARLLLAVAALRDHDPGHARSILLALSKEFPRNHLYAEELARMH
jgi:hypothetical protein